MLLLRAMVPSSTTAIWTTGWSGATPSRRGDSRWRTALRAGSVTPMIRRMSCGSFCDHGDQLTGFLLGGRSCASASRREQLHQVLEQRGGDVAGGGARGAGDELSDDVLRARRRRRGR